MQASRTEQATNKADRKALDRLWRDICRLPDAKDNRPKAQKRRAAVLAAVRKASK